MTWKQIEKSREIRLWLKDILIPTTLGLAYLYNAVPSFRLWVLDKKDKVTVKFKH